MSEIYGQLRTGTPMSERQSFDAVLHHLTCMREALRGIATYHRKDARWMRPVYALDAMETSIKRLRDEGGPRVLWLPERPAWRE